MTTKYVIGLNKYGVRGRVLGWIVTNGAWGNASYNVAMEESFNNPSEAAIKSSGLKMWGLWSSAQGLMLHPGDSVVAQADIGEPFQYSTPEYLIKSVPGTIQGNIPVVTQPIITPITPIPQLNPNAPVTTPTITPPTPASPATTSPTTSPITSVVETVKKAPTQISLVVVGIIVVIVYYLFFRRK